MSWIVTTLESDYIINKVGLLKPKAEVIDSQISAPLQFGDEVTAKLWITGCGIRTPLQAKELSKVF